MLETRGICKQFGDVYAVHGVYLSIPEGQMVGIIGPGAGKSTLLRLLNRLVDLTHGRITCDGIDVGSLKGRALHVWRAQCAMIFQQFNLVHRLDVITNVLIGRLHHCGTLSSLLQYLPRADRAMAIRALERLDMASFALQRADTLSGGQQQRVAIARALVQEPRILLADEPIASLDLHNASKVMAALKTINREDGITVICTLHHVDTARHYCDRIIGMTQGQITFGYHAAILVKTDSPYQSIDGLKGKKFAFADPNSTSGHQAPRYFLREQGYDVDTFFGETAFSGSHENSVMALLNGTFDAVATWWNTEEYSNPRRMEMKGMIPPGQWRIIWKSPKLPSSPWAMPTFLPEQMRKDITEALFQMPKDDPAAWEALTMGKMKELWRVTHTDYEPIVHMIQYNLEKRRLN